MKKIMTLALMMTIAITATALPIDMAEREALFLTDKMAYELNLDDEQYELAYEINLDYLLSVNHERDLYGSWWSRRNADLRYVLSRYQWDRYVRLNYFYRPLAWRGGRWYYPIYGRYTNRGYYYRARPHGYAVYRGGHNRLDNYYHGSQYRHDRGPHGGYHQGPANHGNHNYNHNNHSGNYNGNNHNYNNGNHNPNHNYNQGNYGGNGNRRFAPQTSGGRSGRR